MPLRPVTGGAGVLGLTATRALLEHGIARIWLFDVAPSFASARNKINAMRQQYHEVEIAEACVDVTDESAVGAAVARVGRVDVLLCFAGVVGCAHAADVRADDWRRVVDVNLTGSWFCAQAVGRYVVRFVRSLDTRKAD